MNEEPPAKRRLLTADKNDTTDEDVSGTSIHNISRREDQLLERPFDVIPDEILTEILFPLLLPLSYSSLHLVCWCWRRLLIRDAHILPKLKFSGSRTINFKDFQCTAWKNNRSMVKCCNVDGTGSGAHLLDLLRHIDLTKQGIQFGDNFQVTDVLLKQLVNVISVRPSALIFTGCDMTNITENDLLAFFTAMAKYGSCSDLSFSLSSNDLLNPGVVTDRALEPIISSGTLKKLFLRLPNYDNDATLSSGVVEDGSAIDYGGITDDTLANYSSNFPSHFHIHMQPGCKITPQGIWNFVSAFRASATSNSGCIDFLTSLGNDFRDFCNKNGHTSSDQQFSWSFEKSASSSLGVIFLC